MQSFHEETVRRASGLFGGRLPLVLLMEPHDAPLWPDEAAMRSVARFAGGIGPGKAMLEAQPLRVAWAHAAGLRVTPWTFRAGAHGQFPSVRDEMAYFLTELDVDAVITDNPDAFPRDRVGR